MRSGGLGHVTMPNFIKIGPSTKEILRPFIMPNFVKITLGQYTERYCNFSRSQSLPCWIFKFVKFFDWRGADGRDASLGQINLNLANPCWRYCDFSIYQDGRRRHLGFSKSRFFVFFLDLFGAHLDYPRRVLNGLYHCAKFGYDRYSSFDNMNVSIYGEFG